jgi:hypothetical protein
MKANIKGETVDYVVGWTNAETHLDSFGTFYPGLVVKEAKDGTLLRMVAIPTAQLDAQIEIYRRNHCTFSLGNSEDNDRTERILPEKLRYYSRSVSFLKRLAARDVRRDYNPDSIIMAFIFAENRMECEKLPAAQKLGQAVIDGNLNEIRRLVKHGADVNQIYRSDSCLMTACHIGNLEVVDALLTLGADVNAVSTDKLTALIIAAARGCCPIVDALIRAGAQVQVAGWLGCTALWAALVNGHVEAMRLLLQQGASPFIEDSDGCALLAWAKKHEKHTAAKCLVENLLQSFGKSLASD